jgi:aerobic carbon-monoxide dehydrogenase large subunit
LAEKNKRVEDLRLLIGQGRFVDDIAQEKTLYLGLVRSSYPHANIKKVDFSKARKNPDFIDALQGEELKSAVNALTQIPRQKPAPRYQLATGKVRFVGEPVAAILSKTKYSVEDIIEDVEVEYDQLPAVMTIEQSKNRTAILFDSVEDNVTLRHSAKKGDAEKEISSSPFVVRAKVGIRRQEGVPIEPRSVVASYDEQKDEYTVYGTVQSAFRLREYLSNELKIAPDKIHSIVRDVGGGFGTKGAQSYPEPLLACVFAKRNKMTVKWASTRTEDFLETAAGRDQYCEVTLACNSNGKFTALKARTEADVGVSGTLSFPVLNSLTLIVGPYKIPNIDLEGSCHLTNKAPLGPVRGAGRPEGVYFIERAIDLMAEKMGLDPIELRKRNVIGPDEFPYDNGSGGVYDSGNFALLLDTLEEASHYDQLKKWKIETNQGGQEPAGIGVCLEIEDTGAQLKETARVTLTRDGDVLVATGLSPHGQGLETSLAQLASKELGIPLDRITVVYGDSSSLPWGVGTFGSRSMAVGGSSVVDACRKAKADLMRGASELLHAEQSKTVLEEGEFFEESGGPMMTRRKLASVSSVLEKVGPIEAYSDFQLKSLPFASGAHLCALTVDRETGKVKIKKYVAVDDCGVVINSTIVDGQLHGGVVHGIGGSLLEKVVYSEDGQVLTSSFLDYTICSSLDVPAIIETAHVETPSPLTLNGSKGVGEAGTVAAYPAIMNALNDAIRGSTREQLNIAPAFPEDVLRALNG